jgi:D-3-phosphoglycerate dehydrogenase
MNTRALTSAAIAGLLRPMLQDVNVVSAPVVAKERGIVVEETRREAEGDYESLINVTVVTDRQTRSVAGTVYADGRPRIVNIKGIRVDAEFGPSMLYVTNQDKPGFIGRFGATLAGAGINIISITTSEIRITCLIDEAQVTPAARALHQAFSLDE